MKVLRIKQLLNVLLLALLLLAVVPATYAQSGRGGVNTPAEQAPDANATGDDADDLLDTRVPTSIVVQSVAADSSIFDWVILVQTIAIGLILTVLLYTTPVAERAGSARRCARPTPAPTKRPENDRDA